MHNDSNYPILIVGAGIGGLTAAYALRKKGSNVEVFERAKEPILEKDAGLRIWSNATTALSKLGLHEQIQDAGATIDKLQIWTSGGLLLTENSIHELAEEIGTPSIGIRHSDLMRVLLDACRDIHIHFNSRCVAYSPRDGGGVILRLDDGQEFPGKLVIGADGLHSPIRAQLVGDGDPEYTGHTFWRGMSDGPANLEKGTVYTVWGTHNMHAGCWYVDDNHIAWFIRADAPVGVRDAPGTLKPGLLELMKGVSGPFDHLLDHTPEEHISRTDIYARARVAYVRLDPVALLGDAAHTMPNVLGQGVGQTIEDSLVLAESLAEAPDAIAGLALYEKRRMPRVKWVREQVYLADRGEGAEHPLILWIRNMASQLAAPNSALEMWRELVTFPD
jgi:2-polyprenyl-6-methoxyphenol hydroxylase-like FAD-dependent oxidoreductase